MTIVPVQEVKSYKRDIQKKLYEIYNLNTELFRKIREADTLIKELTEVLKRFNDKVKPGDFDKDDAEEVSEIVNTILHESISLADGIQKNVKYRMGFFEKTNNKCLDELDRFEEFLD